MHQAFAGTSFGVAVVEVPAGGFERGFCGDGGVFVGGLVTGLGAMTRISVFGWEIIFLVTHDEGFNNQVRL